MRQLNEIDTFGGIDADTDNLLDICFEDHEAFFQARDHQRFLVLGRKGSGKTAIFRKFITTREHSFFSFGHTFTDYPWHHHDKQAAVGVPEEERYVHSWRYLSLLSVAKILLNQDQSQPWSEKSFEDIRKIEKFVIDSYGSRDPDVTEIFSPAKTLRFKASFEIPLTSLKVGVETGSVPVDHLPTIIQDVNRSLTKAVLETLNPDFDYFVCFDQLDLGFSPADNNYKNRLIGLILAARDINVRAREEGKKLSILIFLRDDIYQTLRFEDKNKMTEAFTTRIEWDTERTNRTLKDLMQKRFSTVLDIPENGAWNLVYDEKEQMPGRQTKYQHMIDRTFLRPRDMIKFCNETLKAHKLLPADERGNLFDNRAINNARTEYSQYFLSELDDEIFKHLVNYEAYIEVLKTLESLQFKKEDFIDACALRARMLPPDYDPIRILSELFEFSLVGYYAPGGGGYGGSEYIWRYRDSRARFNEAAINFRIHPGLKETLGLKKFSRSS